MDVVPAREPLSPGNIPHGTERQPWSKCAWATSWQDLDAGTIHSNPLKRYWVSPGQGLGDWMVI